VVEQRGSRNLRRRSCASQTDDVGEAWDYAVLLCVFGCREFDIIRYNSTVALRRIHSSPQQRH
jgi:hypothetical protein